MMMKQVDTYIQWKVLEDDQWDRCLLK